MNNKISHDSEIPAHGQQVITACAFIYHDFGGVEKVFLPRRANTKKFLPGVFELPGGHIDFDENIVEGLKREIMEEFSMHMNVGDPFAAFTYSNEVKGSHSIEVIYLAEFEDPIENIIIHPEYHSTFEWIAENELQKITSTDKGNDDPEIQAMRKGFALLRRERPSYGEKIK